MHPCMQILIVSTGKHFVRFKRSDPGSLNNVFGPTCLHGGAEVRDLGHMQMSCLYYFQHVLIHLELAAE